MTTATEQVLGELSDAWSARDCDRVVACFSEKGVYAASIGPEPGERATGHTAIRKLVTRMFATDEGAGTTISYKVVTDGVAFWTWRYTLPNGVEELGSDLLIVEDGLIVLKDAYRKVRSDD